MRFNPLFAAAIGLCAIAAVPVLVKGAEQGGGEADKTEQPQKVATTVIVANDHARADLSKHHERNQSDDQLDPASPVWTNWIQAISAAAVAAFTFFLWRLQSRQVRLTASALQEAADATSAMQASNEIARESMETQLRAYLDFDDVGWLLEEKQGDDPHIFSGGVRTRIRNYGHTPASEIVCEMCFLIRDSGGNEVNMLAEERIVENWGAIAPTDHLTKRSSFDIPKWIWDLIGNKKGTLIAQFALSYADKFGRSHVLESHFESLGHENLFGFLLGTRKSD